MGCYIAAWVLASVRAVAGLIKMASDIAGHKGISALKEALFLYPKSKVTHRAVN